MKIPRENKRNTYISSLWLIDNPLMKTITILGSSRKDGETYKVICETVENSDWDIIDLNDYTFSYYDYEHNNRNDDFLPLMKKIVENYDTLIFATPVYWYSMSGIMKVFFDRLTDLLEIDKELGRKLAGKRMGVISSSIGNHLGEAFWLPFSETAKYFNMDYIGNIHTITGKNNQLEISKFTDLVNNKNDPQQAV